MRDFREQAAGDHAAFDVQYAAERQFLQMTLRGVWDDATFDAFGAAYSRAVTHMAETGGVHLSLVDATGFGVQTADITDRFQALLHQVDPGAKRRAAIVTAAIVTKVQARQVGDQLNARYFRTVDSAREWLFGDEA